MQERSFKELKLRNIKLSKTETKLMHEADAGFDVFSTIPFYGKDFNHLPRIAKEKGYIFYADLGCYNSSYTGGKIAHLLMFIKGDFVKLIDMTSEIDYNLRAMVTAGGEKGTSAYIPLNKLSVTYKDYTIATSGFTYERPGSPVAGAIIGAAIGGSVGAVIGSQIFGSPKKVTKLGTIHDMESITFEFSNGLTFKIDGEKGDPSSYGKIKKYGDIDALNEAIKKATNFDVRKKIINRLEEKIGKKGSLKDVNYFQKDDKLFEQIIDNIKDIKELEKEYDAIVSLYNIRKDQMRKAEALTQKWLELDAQKTFFNKKKKQFILDEKEKIQSQIKNIGKIAEVNDILNEIQSES